MKERKEEPSVVVLYPRQRLSVIVSALPCWHVKPFSMLNKKVLGGTDWTGRFTLRVFPATAGDLGSISDTCLGCLQYL